MDIDYNYAAAIGSKAACAEKQLIDIGFVSENGKLVWSQTAYGFLEQEASDCFPSYRRTRTTWRHWLLLKTRRRRVMGRNSERDEREAIRRKNQLINAGFELFSANGIETVSLNAVAEKADVGVV